MKLSITTFITIILTLLTSAMHAQSSTATPVKKYTAQALKEDLQILRYCLETTHPGLYTYTSKGVMDKAFEQLETSCNQPMTAIEFYREIATLNQFIQNAHTDIDPPKVYKEQMKKTVKLFPFSVYSHHGKLFVLENNSSVEGIEQGSEIKSINGENAQEVFQELMEYIPTDGVNRTFPQLRVNKKFNIYYAYFKGTPTSYQIELTQPNGTNTKVSVPANTWEEIKQHRLQRYQRASKSWLKTKAPFLLFEINGNTAIMTIKIFQNAYLRKVNQRFNKYLKESFAAMKRAGVKHLVIDLRNNYGGDEKNIARLFSQVYNQPFPLFKESTAPIRKIPNKKYYVEKSLLNLIMPLFLKKAEEGFEVKGSQKIHKPAKHVYHGEIYVLTNGFSCSATGYLASLFRNYQRGVIIGEEPGGNQNQCAAGIFKTLRLPNTKNTIRMPLYLSVLNVDMPNTGHGVIPDYEIRPNIHQMLRKEDVVMDFTLKLIEEGKEKAIQKNN